ncbi:MAG: hypothetical protein AABX93_02305 [Nanoarchaeota archaeon]
MKKLFEDFKKGQKAFGDDISSVVNFVLLTFTYFVGVGLTSIFAKIIGKHFLELNIKKDKETYWSELNLNKEPMENYYRQF